ncbi:GAF domain-containing protein [Solirubrobacter pauli]|uniref:GAF domain-containing protein n=1 Tax=Solirubrobacter pauli TaxID=166793 RepID=UPI0014768E70|nr:GAF domain-containing protein [Solirubrobacter pauli]
MAGSRSTISSPHVVPAVVLLGITLLGFVGSALLAQAGARQDAGRRADVAAAQIRAHVEHGASLSAGLAGFMATFDAERVPTDAFARVTSRWLSPSGFPAAAWVEDVPGDRRAAYERRIGHPIVDLGGRTGAPARPRGAYVPATFVSGGPPLSRPGVDLGGVPGLPTAMWRARALRVPGVTPLAALPDGSRGLFVISPAERRDTRLGFAVLFLSEATLRAAVTDIRDLRLATAEQRGRVDSVRRSFTVAGQRLDLDIDPGPPRNAAAVLPWIVLVGGVLLAWLAVAWGSSASRRARAQEELDRIFMQSKDVIAVLDAHGQVRRVNPGVEQVLGYTRDELVGQPYAAFVHPDDRARTALHAAAVARGDVRQTFENRVVHKDGSERVLEWHATPAVEDGVAFATGRDVTERRIIETALERIVGEQTALRRVATLIARGDLPESVFPAVVAEVGQFLEGDLAGMARYDDDGTLTVMAWWSAAGDHSAVRGRWKIDEGDLVARIIDSGRAARIDDWSTVPGRTAALLRDRMGVRSSVGTAIRVGGRTWGGLCVHRNGPDPLPDDTADRLEGFAELIATAVANAEARAETDALVREQTALQRVTTLVAQAAPPAAVFDAVAAETAGLLDAESVVVSRYDAGRQLTALAHFGAVDGPADGCARRDADRAEAIVRETGHTARVDRVGEAGDETRAVTLAAPIVVEGSTWGVLTVRSVTPPPGADARLEQFAQLLGTAIANADSRDQLMASRARLLAAGDEARRHVVRDLHDGAQQRLVHATIALKLALRAFETGGDDARALVAEALEHTEQGNVALRELVHGILPALLTTSGVHAAIDALVESFDVPIEVAVTEERFATEIEASAYFIVAEALTNVVKHAHASRAVVAGTIEHGVLHLEISDDGIGGADPAGGGLVGIRDRATALGGQLEVHSPPGHGTRLTVTLPL